MALPDDLTGWTRPPNPGLWCLEAVEIGSGWWGPATLAMLLLHLAPRCPSVWENPSFTDPWQYLLWHLFFTELLFVSFLPPFSASLSHSIFWAGYTVFLFPMAPVPPHILMVQLPDSGIFSVRLCCFFCIFFIFLPCFGSFHPQMGFSFCLLFCVVVGNSFSILAAWVVLASQKRRIFKERFEVKNTLNL